MTLGEGLESRDHLERNDRGERPLPQTATARPSPRAQASGRGHTWQPLALYYLGTLCGVRLALCLPIPETR